MERPFLKRGMILGFLVFVLCLLVTGGTWADDASGLYPIMKPDRETRLRWINDYETAPRAYIDRSRDFSFAPGGSLSLLGHLPYTPSQRNQGSCGNCWAWAGTGVMEIALDVQEGIFERLSVQYLNSCFGTGAGYACCGGWLKDLTDFYASRYQVVPWSNTNASYQDGSRTCATETPAVSCGSVAISPSYGVDFIETQTIPTHGVGQATAIANIKNVLNQNKAVWFAFFMCTAEDWNSFFSFWSNQPESAVWDFDPTCNKPWSQADGGGHAVLCVGYNDDNPANAYWIMVNSWGTTAGRPNGIFRVAMDMNYDCAETSGDKNLYWQTLGVTFNAGGQTVYVDRAGSCNGYSPCSSTIQGGIALAATGATIKIDGGTYPEDVDLNVDKNLTFKGGYNSTYSTQTMETVCRKFTIGKGTAVMDKVTVADTPAADVASAVLYNNVFFGGNPFTATFTIDGVPLTSLSGNYSSYEEVNCGVSVGWSLYANAEPCGTTSRSGSVTLTCDCLYEILLDLDEFGNPAIYLFSTCPGDCSDVTSLPIGSRQLLDCVRISKDAGLQGLEALTPLSVE
jgi:hypothetical protein